MSTTEVRSTPPKVSPNTLNITVDIAWARVGEEPLVDECYALTSPDPLFSAAEALREMADRLDPPYR